jgi:hypothetical protein
MWRVFPIFTFRMGILKGNVTHVPNVGTFWARQGRRDTYNEAKSADFKNSGAKFRMFMTSGRHI